jgi:hypothetical protein
MDRNTIRAIVSGIAPAIKDKIDEKIESATAPLKARIAELESQPFLREAGIWESEKSYGMGAVVTDHGSAWVCKQPTTERPGESSHWRLLVKRGRDGKDAEDNRPGRRLPTMPRSGGR